MSLDAALSIAASGLRAAERGLHTVAANVAGAETPGYTRKVLSRTALVTGESFAGVRTGSVQRAVDEALQQRLFAAVSDAEALAVRERFLAPVEALHGTPEHGDSLGGLVAALQDRFSLLLASPASAARQNDVIDAADTLARRLNALSEAVTTQRQGVQDELVNALDSVNQSLARVDELTRAIRAELAAGRGAAELEDQRDAELVQLAANLDLTFVKQADGGLSLIGRNGFTLSLGTGDRLVTTSIHLTASSYYDPAGGTIPAIELRSSDPSVPPQDVTGLLVGGRIGELIRLRDEVLPRQQAELDVLAYGLATRFDEQGLRLFTDAAGGVPEAGPAPDPQGFVGFAAQLQVNPEVRASPHKVRDGTHAVAATPGGPTAFTPNPAGGPESFAELAQRVVDFVFGRERAPGVPHEPLPSRGLGPGGNLASSVAAAPTLAGYAASLVAVQVGEHARATAALQDATAFRATLEARFADKSGVNVDAELGLMLQLQNAYQANARVIAASEAMWQALLAAVR